MFFCPQKVEKTTSKSCILMVVGRFFSLQPRLPKAAQNLISVLWFFFYPIVSAKRSLITSYLASLEQISSSYQARTWKLSRICTWCCGVGKEVWYWPNTLHTAQLYHISSTNFQIKFSENIFYNSIMEIWKRQDVVKSDTKLNHFCFFLF